MKHGFCINCPFNNTKRPMSPCFLELIDEQNHVHVCHTKVEGTGNDPNGIRIVPKNNNEICYGHLTYRETKENIDRWENEGGSWQDIEPND